MNAELPDNWATVGTLVLAVVLWLMRLESRLTSKVDMKESQEYRDTERTRTDTLREEEHKRVDQLFKETFASMDKRHEENQRFREEMRRDMQGISNKLTDLRVLVAKKGVDDE
jgi:hypothetical protein